MEWLEVQNWRDCIWLGLIAFFASYGFMTFLLEVPYMPADDGKAGRNEGDGTEE